MKNNIARKKWGIENDIYVYTDITKKKKEKNYGISSTSCECVRAPRGLVKLHSRFAGCCFPWGIEMTMFGTYRILRVIE